MNFRTQLFLTLRSKRGANKWHQAEQYSFKNVIVKSRQLVNKCKIAKRRTTGVKYIESARGSENMTR